MIVYDFPPVFLNVFKYCLLYSLFVCVCVISEYTSNPAAPYSFGVCNWSLSAESSHTRTIPTEAKQLKKMQAHIIWHSCSEITYESSVSVQNRWNLVGWNRFGPVRLEAYLNFSFACLHGFHLLIARAGYGKSVPDCIKWLARRLNSSVLLSLLLLFWRKTSKPFAVVCQLSVVYLVYHWNN